MNELELNFFMVNVDFNIQTKYKIKVLKESEFVIVRGIIEKSNDYVLLLFFEDNSIVIGIISIFY